jgi:hypothetical protein
VESTNRTPVRLERLDEAMVPIYRAMSSAQRVVAGLSATDMIRDRLTATVSDLAGRTGLEALLDTVIEA